MRARKEDRTQGHREARMGEGRKGRENDGGTGWKGKDGDGKDPLLTSLWLVASRVTD